MAIGLDSSALASARVYSLGPMPFPELGEKGAKDRKPRLEIFCGYIFQWRLTNCRRHSLRPFQLA